MCRSHCNGIMFDIYLLICYVLLLQPRALESSSSEFRYSEKYEVPAEILQCKGGITNAKAEHVLLGNVFLVPSLRRLLFASGNILLPHVNLNELAICEGTLVGFDAQNRSRAFAMFACPMDDGQAAGIRGLGEIGERLEAFCCRKAPNQRCCDKEEFFKERGTTKAAAVVATRLTVVLAVVIASLVFCVCVCVVICVCVFVKPSRRPKKLARLYGLATHSEATPAAPAAATPQRPQHSEMTATYTPSLYPQIKPDAGAQPAQPPNPAQK